MSCFVQNFGISQYFLKFKGQGSCHPQRSQTRSKIFAVRQDITQKSGISLPQHEYERLEKINAAWRKLCAQDQYRQYEKVAFRVRDRYKQKLQQDLGYDVVILGGTMGVFLGAVLVKKGLKVAIVEKNKLIGRDQEWNITKSDMHVLLKLGLLSQEQINECIVSEFNPVRMGIRGIDELVVNDVLNCGVSPKIVLEFLRKKFVEDGGQLYQGAAFQSMTAYDDCAVVKLKVSQKPEEVAGGAGSVGQQLTQQQSSSREQSQSQALLNLKTSIVVDAMGNFSPIVAQCRRGRKPDSTVMLVGTCTKGLPTPSCADLLYSFQPLNTERRVQYFWERFPAVDGLTTYMFCFTQPSLRCADFIQMYADYVDSLPEYMDMKYEDVDIQVARYMFGFVPCHLDGPCKPCVDRLTFFGDSAGNGSALTFAGFASMTRHLQRVSNAVEQAVSLNVSNREDLELVQPWFPAAGITCAMQASMGTRDSQIFAQGSNDVNLINQYLAGNVNKMKQMGEGMWRPFLMDYYLPNIMKRLIGEELSNNLEKNIEMSKFISAPESGLQMLQSLSGLVVLESLHQTCGCDSQFGRNLDQLLQGIDKKALYRWRRTQDAWKFGSAQDYWDTNVRENI